MLDKYDCRRPKKCNTYCFFTARMVRWTHQYFVYTYIVSVVAHVIICYMDQRYLSLYSGAILKNNRVFMRMNTRRSTTTRFMFSSPFENNFIKTAVKLYTLWGTHCPDTQSGFGNNTTAPVPVGCVNHICEFFSSVKTVQIKYLYKSTRCTKFLWLDFIFH